jgi:NAD+ kinase
MKRIGLVVKDDAGARALAEKVRDYLSSRGIDVTVDTEKEEECRIDRMEVDLFVVLGGDGTILKTIAKARNKDTPILGINFGTTGFLTQIEPDKWEVALEKVLSGEFKIEERSKVDAIVGEARGSALNEVALVSATPVEILHLELSIDGEKVQDIKADGVIVSTPTGSTAYSRSCGGPVVDPRVECFIITSICPFMGGIKSLVVPQKSRVEILLEGKSSGIVVVDGELKMPLDVGSSVCFTLSREKARFVKVRDGFYAKLREGS